MAAIEVVSGYTTGAGTTDTILTPCTGNSFTLRHTDPTKKVYLIGIWTHHIAAGYIHLRSPRMHDNVVGIRFDVSATNVGNLLLPENGQILYPQDTLIFSQTGHATDVDASSLLVFYEDLPGSNGNYKFWDDIKDNILNVLVVPVAITSVAAGDYTGQVAINSLLDPFKSNTDYALLGAFCYADRACTLQIISSDTGNLGVGVPLPRLDYTLNSGFFVNLSRKTGLPCIPIINSANKSNTLVAIQDIVGTTSFIANIVLAELKG